MSQAPSEALAVKNPGIRLVLKYSGIPTSWLDKPPKLPSRNWLIFISVTSSIAGLYVYDRRECKKIKQHYIDRVRELSERPSSPMDLPRKVTVYGAKWPGDEEYDASIKYFRKYVKPVLVAAAVDYDLIPGKRHGDIARHVAEDVRKRRRLDAGIDEVSQITKTLPTYKPLPELRQHELKGGIILVGRPTFKEFMAGLIKGWTQSLQKVDHEELLAQELTEDGHFDELEEPSEGERETTQKSPPKLTHLISPVFSPLRQAPTPTTSGQTKADATIPVGFDEVPQTIPQLPPLLLVPYVDYIGFTQIPLMIWDFFNQRHKVRSGAEAGYKLVMGLQRPIIPPLTSSEATKEAPAPKGEKKDDLSFGVSTEHYYKKSLNNFATDIEKARKKYYEALPNKLKVAREIARGTREPTKDEEQRPPPTEMELRADRLKKEQRWRNDLEGWELVKPSQEVIWDNRFKNALTIFTNPDKPSSTQA